MARFGDIQQISVVGKDDAEVTMKSGATFQVSGYANDVGADINVRDAELGDIEVAWRKIKTINFKATPDAVKPDGYRLHGTVTTDAGEFEGYIQWDSQECLSTDELDGDSEDGRLAIEMGKIKSIERRTRRSAKVILTDGRELVLDGTNDVNDSIRGILIEDPRYGRIEVPWGAFEKLELSTGKGSGPAYDDFAEPKTLRGTVTARGDKKHQGEIVFDLDETETWEMLNGESFDIEYSIPFAQVASIVRRGSTASIVTLRSGEELRLEDGQDVSKRNDGILIIKGKKKQYIPWRDLNRIDFEE
jgi:hypothetical protein